MIEIRPSNERGTADYGWLKARHSFSFGRYRDPDHMGFGPLRVINEDRVAAGKGFDPHPHDNMEIITYVIDGALAHKDSMGNGSTIRPGEIQYMSAGSGVTHSEYNASESDPVHLLQIWLVPNKQDVEPRYAEQSFNAPQVDGKLHLLASPDGRNNSVSMHTGVDLYVARLNGDQEINFTVRNNRIQWVQVVKGSLAVNNQPLVQGDGAAIMNEAVLTLRSGQNAEVLLFDMAR